MPILQSGDAAFDPQSPVVAICVMWDRRVAPKLRLDVWHNPDIFQEAAEPVGVIAAVDELGSRVGQITHQGARTDVVVCLATAQEHLYRSPDGIRDDVNFSVRAAFRVHCPLKIGSFEAGVFR
ncbi:MAG: hypothetical protein AAFR75_06125 [Pseudomonadota bacterium]